MAKTQEIKDKIVDVSLKLSAQMGWDTVGFIDIASEAKIDLEDLYAHFDDKEEILSAYGKRIDARVIEAVGEMGVVESCRDRLFDVLMERFDIINEDRAGLLSILKSFEYDPKQAVISLPHLGKSMTKMLELCKMETNGIRGAIRVAGLSALYLKILHVWKTDTSDDMAKVMAELDKDLGRAESVANFLSI